MTKAAYMQQRAPYNRPQAMLWADNSGTLVAYPSTVNSIPVSNFENATTNWSTLHPAEAQELLLLFWGHQKVL